MKNQSTFLLACLFYFTVHQCMKLFGPKGKQNKQVIKEVKTYCIKFCRSV